MDTKHNHINKLIQRVQDTAGMGRLLGIKHFLGQAALIEEKSDAADIRRAKKDLPEEIDLEDDEDETQENPLKLCQIQISRRHQENFQGLVIRRTPSSIDWEGKVLIDLPDYKTVLGLVELTEREVTIISDIMTSIKDRYVHRYTTPCCVFLLTLPLVPLLLTQTPRFLQRHSISRLAWQ